MKTTKTELQARVTELEAQELEWVKTEVELRQENKRVLSLLRHVIVQYSELVRDSMLREAGLYQPKKEK